MIAAPTYAFCLGATKAGTSWLHTQLEADDQLDPLEKALLAFIAEETGEEFIP